MLKAVILYISILFLSHALVCEESSFSEFEKHHKKVAEFYEKKDWNNFLLEIEILQKFSETKKEKILVISLKSSYYIDQKEYVKAVPYYEEILKIDDTDLDALEALGFIYQSREFGADLDTKARKSLPYILRAEELGSKSPELYYGITCIYSLQKEIDKALQYLDKAIYNGYDNIEHIKKDKDLDNIRNTEYYIRLSENWEKLKSAKEEIQAAEYAARSGKTDDAVQKLLNAKDNIVHSLGENSLSLSSVLLELSKAYEIRSDFENAAFSAKKSFEIRQKILGNNHYETIASEEALKSYNAEIKARLHPKYKMLEEAFRLWKFEGDDQYYDDEKLALILRNVFNLEKEIYGKAGHRSDSIKFDMKLFFVQGKLGLLTGNYEKSESKVRKACIVKEIVFPQTKETAECRLMLGELYQRQNKYNESARNYHLALSIFIDTLGKNHSDTASAYSRLGNLYYFYGEYEEALKYNSKTLDIRLKLFGENHLNTAESYNVVGLTYNSMEEYDKALKYIKKALDIRLKHLGENHPDTASSYNDLAGAYDSRGEYDKAIEYYRKSLSILLKTFGENHPITATVYNNLGSIHHSKGEYKKALVYLNVSLHIRLKTLGENHPDVSVSYQNLASLYSSRGEYNKAVEFFSKSLSVMIKVYGENHSNVGIAYNNLGNLYTSLGDLNTAVTLYEKSLTNLRRTENKIGFLDALNNAKDTYIKLKENQKAVSVLEEAVSFIIANRKESSGGHKYKFTENYSHFFKELASLYQKSGLLTEARKINRKMRNIFNVKKK